MSGFAWSAALILQNPASPTTYKASTNKTYGIKTKKEEKRREKRKANKFFWKINSIVGESILVAW